MSDPVADNSTVAVRFFLDGEASPGFLPRLLQPLAKRDLTPERMWTSTNAGTIHAEIELRMPADCTHLVEGNLRQIVGVTSISRRLVNG